MKRTALLLASTALTLLVAAGVAWAATIDCDGDNRCYGTGEPDIINGTDQTERIYGGGGGDKMLGNGGSDDFYGGEGDDVAKGGVGGDSVYVSPHILGDDTYYAGPGDDVLEEPVGRNVLLGGPGKDYIYGHSKLVGNRGDDYIVGYARNYDTVDEGPRRILGGPGFDQIRSQGTTNDTVFISDDERDTVKCGEGSDTVYFDKGTDRFVKNSGCENRIAR